MNCCFPVAHSNEMPPFLLLLLNDLVYCQTVFFGVKHLSLLRQLMFIVDAVSVTLFSPSLSAPSPTHTHLHRTLPVVTFLKQSLLITGKGLRNILSERSMRGS